jgi:hypothetical protein
MKVELRDFLTSTIDEAKQSAPRSGSNIVGVRYPSTHPVREWMSLKIDLDNLGKRKLSCSDWNPAMISRFFCPHVAIIFSILYWPHTLTL